MTHSGLGACRNSCNWHSTAILEHRQRIVRVREAVGAHRDRELQLGVAVALAIAYISIWTIWTYVMHKQVAMFDAYIYHNIDYRIFTCAQTRAPLPPVPRP